MPRRRSDHDARLTGLAQLAEEQDRVASRKQLRVLGFDAHFVHRQVSAGRWRQIGPNVVVLHTGPLSARQREWVAVVHSGPSAALCGFSALQAEGVAGFEPSCIQTVVPHGSAASNLDHELVQVRITQTRVMIPAEIHPVRQPARQRLPFAVITAASSAATDARARLVVISAIQQRRVRPDELRYALGRRTKVRRRSLIIEAIADAEGGIHSLPERQWLTLMRRYGFPRATRQQPVRRSGGTWYLDCDFEAFHVTVEINGAQHEALLLAESDNQRRNVLAIAGRLVITLSSHAVRHDSGTCVAVVAAALLSRGWVPSAPQVVQLQDVANRAGIDLSSGGRLRGSTESNFRRATGT